MNFKTQFPAQRKQEEDGALFVAGKLVVNKCM